MNYFDDPNSKHFSFQSFAVGLDENTFGVINFKGYEAISKTYDFEIMLVSSKKDIDLEDLLQAQAVFTIHRGENDNVLFNGILAEFDQLHEVNDVIFYRARLVPKLWWLTLTHHNQVFLEQSIPDIVDDALRDGGLETADIDVGALSGYEENSYVCQYDESHFNFVSRCLERQGIYYYFVQEDDGEVLTLTDTKFSHFALKQGSDLFYNPASGLEGKHLGETIGSFTCRQKQLPAEIILKDYNYERPSLDITSRADVDPVGRGTSYLYGEYFATPEDGERLAGIRAEELLCKKQEFFGESTVPYINPGFTFSLNNHYREDFNQEYLILEVTHEGNQSHLMSGGITTDSGKSHNQAIYHNSFKAIPNETQYRPDRITEKPKISGTIHAKIDSEVDGEYAQLDEQGRYHVRLPFDINDEHLDGKGSAPIRMMQSYAGKDRGMQFPLVKGTEVLLTFIEGNPDRPVIAGAVSNPETQGPVSAENQSESVIQTGGNNKIRMEDKEGSARILLETPSAGSWIRVGAPNDPLPLPAVEDQDAGDGIRIQSSTGSIWFESGYGFGDYHGGSKPTALSHPAPSSNQSLIDKFVGTTPDYNPTGIQDYGDKFYADDDHASSDYSNAANAEKLAKDDYDTAKEQFETAASAIPAGLRYVLESSTNHGLGMTPGGGLARLDSYIRLTSVEKAEFAEYIRTEGLLDTANTAYSQTRETTDRLKSSQNIVAESKLEDIINTDRVHLRVSAMDTITTQEGNIYDFGGYWNYNLGNSYAEDHLDQSAVLNAEHRGDLLNLGGPEFTGWRTANISDGATAGANTSVSKNSNMPAHAESKSWTNIWVQKTFGDTYEYTDGNTISVTKGSTQEIEIGGVHVEEAYRGDGSIKSRSVRGLPGGQPSTEEKWTSAGKLVYKSSSLVTPVTSWETENKYDCGTGVLYSYSGSNGTGMSRSSFDFDFSANASMNINAGAQTATDIYLLVKNSNSVFVGGEVNVSAYAGFSASLSLCAALKIDSEFAAAGILKNENTEWSLSLMGTKLKGTTTKLETAIANIDTCASAINNIGVKVNSATTDIGAIATVHLRA